MRAGRVTTSLRNAHAHSHWMSNRTIPPFNTTSSSGAHHGDELRDLDLELFALARQRLRRAGHPRRRRPGLAGTAVDVGNIGGDRRRALPRATTAKPRPAFAGAATTTQ